jgi:hypothetical protein
LVEQHGPATVALPAEEVFAVTVTVAGAMTRRTVAAALAGRTPVALRRVDWGWRDLGDGRARVAMAHRDRVDAAARSARMDGRGRAAVAVTGADIVLRAAPVPVSPWWMLAAIPLVTGVGAWALAAEGAGVRVQAEADVAAVFRRASMSEILALLDAGLPPRATVHRVERQADGAMVLEIDVIDPALLRAALARDPSLATFRTTGQDVVADRGIRMRLRSDRL